MHYNKGTTGHRVGNGKFSEERNEVGIRNTAKEAVIKGDSCGVIWNLLSGQIGTF